jgi:hypothetical protein
VGPAKVIEGPLRQHSERAPAREHGLRDGVDRAVPTRGDDNPLLLLCLLYGALRYRSSENELEIQDWLP